MNQVVIVSAVRTPVACFGKTFAKISATQLGATAIRGAIDKVNLKPELVEEVYMGNVVSSGLGQAPARQATLGN